VSIIPPLYPETNPKMTATPIENNTPASAIFSIAGEAWTTDFSMSRPA